MVTLLCILYYILYYEFSILDNAEPRNGSFRPGFFQTGGMSETSVDNPEYHIMNSDVPAHQNLDTLGIPSIIHGAQAPCNGTIAGQRPYVTQQKSSEEESDHEYYNDFDRLQRELQPLKPLRRNETTV
jgi:L1 cell adhesion molecule